MRRLGVAVACGAALTALPVVAPAQSYGRSLFPAACRSEQAGGAALGAILGGLAGNRAAGRGQRTEGSVIGAGLGALVGSQIARAACERDLRKAMLIQAAQTDAAVRVPAGDLNRAMSAQPDEPYVNNRQQSCKDVSLSIEDGSAADQSVTMCEASPGNWVESP